MTVADMKAAIALGIEQAMKLIVADDAPPAPTPTAKPKRKGNPEALRKWRESQKAAVAEKPTRKPRKAKAVDVTPVAKPRKAKADKDGDTTDIGGLTLRTYTREDGTPGVILTRKGRYRGIAFAKGEWAEFVAFVNTIRNGEHMDVLARKVKGRIGG